MPNDTSAPRLRRGCVCTGESIVVVVGSGRLNVEILKKGQCFRILKKNLKKNLQQIPNFFRKKSQILTQHFSVNITLCVFFFNGHLHDFLFSINLSIASWAPQFGRYDLRPVKDFTYGTEEVYCCTTVRYRQRPRMSYLGQ